MRVLTPYELSTMTRPEMNAMLARIAADLPMLPIGSPELRIAHVNLQALRRALAPRPSGPA
jgi:hypothetical protein